MNSTFLNTVFDEMIMKTISRLNGAKLNLSMRDMKPVSIGDRIIHVDTIIHTALVCILEDTGNSSAETIEYLDKLKSQITEIQERLRLL